MPLDANRAPHDRAKSDAGFLRARPRSESQSALGLALAGQGRFEEAEPLVIESRLELQANEALGGVVRREILRDAAERVVQTYTAWGKEENATERNTVTENQPR